MENVAVVGCTVTLSPGEGVAQITTDASLKVKADGKADRPRGHPEKPKDDRAAGEK